MAKIKGFLVLPIEVDEEEWKSTYGVNDAQRDVEAFLTGNGDGVVDHFSEVFASDSGAKVTGVALSWEEVYSMDAVSKAVNAATDYVYEEASDYENDESIRLQDSLNLVGNLTVGFLKDPQKEPTDIIGDAYAATPDSVLNWIRIPG